MYLNLALLLYHILLHIHKLSDFKAVDFDQIWNDVRMQNDWSLHRIQISVTNILKLDSATYLYNLTKQISRSTIVYLHQHCLSVFVFFVFFFFSAVVSPLLDNGLSMMSPLTPFPCVCVPIVLSQLVLFCLTFL